MIATTFFRTKFGEDIFNYKYRHEGCETWDKLSNVLVEDVCRDRMSREDKNQLKKFITDQKFIPGGRYLAYAGRPMKAFNNCFLLKSMEDTREDWANLSWKAESCLTLGGGIGNDYSIYRHKGAKLSRTGGMASGPVSKMKMINEIGREVMQGGSRRSAIWAGLNWKHPDIMEFIHVKDWKHQKVAGTSHSMWDLKQKDYNFPCPLDMTNISVGYDTEWLRKYYDTGEVGDVFLENCKQALETAEPGFSFNFYGKENETARNAPVAGNTYVLTDKGYVQVIDILEKPVTIWTGKQWARNVVFKRTKENTQTINVSFTGGRMITCDPTHEFLVEKYSGKGDRRRFLGIERVKAGELSEGDILHTSLPEVGIKETSSSYYTLGYCYGDGSFRKDYDGAEITLCTEESKSCFEGMNPWLISSNTEKDSRGYQRVYLKGVSNILHFSGRNKSEAPIDISIDNIPSFIAGLFDADGSYDPKQNRVRVSSAQYTFLEGVRRMLESIGILAGISSAGETTYGRSECYNLTIMSEYVSKFSKIIPTIRLKVLGHDPYRRSKIRVTRVEQGDVQDVYCCDVKVEEHSFMAEGVIISNCTEVTSEDDSDVCNLGSINLSRIASKEELRDVVYLATCFLLCGTLVAHLPYDKVYKIREKNRRLGLGMMGIHEWLIQRGHRYEVVPELKEWLQVYKEVSDLASCMFADELSISRPVANRAIAPNGTIGILAGTTTGIEPLFAVAYKRLYLKDGKKWVYQYVIDGTAKQLIREYGVNPDSIESALDLAADYERRIKFQADVQDYVDMAISSTINLPSWGSEIINENTVKPFSSTLAKYAHRLRGFTCYPDGARGGQPLTPVPYEEALKYEGLEFEENYHDVCSLTGGGTCGI